MPLRFNMLLEDAGVAPAQVRLLRHQPKIAERHTIDIWRGDHAAFSDWQSHQMRINRSRFAHAYWASFIGTWDGRTMFAGLYAASPPETLQTDYVDQLSGVTHAAGTVDRYATAKLDLLSDYTGKLYIDWGGGSSGKRAWVQRADQQNKLIDELHRKASERAFPGLLNLTLPLSQLADVPWEWADTLRHSQGVYLLTCPRDGSLYVGSASGTDGFWSRWEAYRADGHGGNVALRQRERSDYLVSILQVAGSTDNSDTILAAEQTWKNKLQSRAFGLNRNG